MNKNRVYCINCTHNKHSLSGNKGCFHPDHTTEEHTAFQMTIKGGDIWEMNRGGSCRMYEETKTPENLHPSRWHSATLETFCEEYRFEWELLHILDDLYKINIISTGIGRIWLAPNGLGSKPSTLKDMEFNICKEILDFRIRHDSTTRVGGSLHPKPSDPPGATS